MKVKVRKPLVLLALAASLAMFSVGASTAQAFPNWGDTLPPTMGPQPNNAEVPPVGGSDGFTCGEDCTYVDGPETGPKPGVWTPCPELDGATVCGDSGDGETGICQRWCVVYNGPAQAVAPAPAEAQQSPPAPPDDPPAADPPPAPPPPAPIFCGDDYDPGC